jgi:mitochondrial import receptor subunit TOM40
MQGPGTLPPNPGPFEQATYDVRRLVTLDTFDGFRCDINKQVSPFMAAVHSFWLGTSMIPDGRRSTYTFLTQVADDKGLYMARIDPSRWSLDGRVHRAVLGGLAMAKVQVSVTPPASNSSGGDAEGGGGGGGGGGGAGSSDQLLAELDFGGLTWTGNVKYGSMGGGVVVGCNYYQAITNRLAAGGEGMYVSANQALLSNYLVKYTVPAATGDEDLFGSAAAPGKGGAAAPATDAAAALPPPSPPSSSSLTASPGGGSATFCLGYNAGHGAATLGYRRIVTPNRVQLATELQFSTFTLDSKLLLGAEFRLARSKIGLCLDAGDGRIQALLEARLGMAPGSPTLNLSADVNHYEDEMRFGYGLTVDG